MKKNNRSGHQTVVYREWSRYPILQLICERQHEGNNTKSDLITSIDKIAEVRAVVEIIINRLNGYRAKNHEEMRTIKEELEAITAQLRFIAQEFDSAGKQVDVICRNTKLQTDPEPTGLSPRAPDAVASYPVGEACGLITGESIHAHKKIDQLILLVKKFGVQVEDSRDEEGGGVIYISLTARPPGEAIAALKSLRKMGARIWPGENFLV